MQIEIIYRSDAQVLLFVDEGNVYHLFKEWEIEEKILKNLIITLEVWHELYSCGKYCGSRGNQHRILVALWVLLGDPQELNRTIIHELRHMFWNLVAPGQHVSKEGFRLRCGEGCLSCDGQRAREEQDDCFACETKYGNFNLAVSVQRYNFNNAY